MPVTNIAKFERFFRTVASLDVDKQDLKRYGNFVNHKTYDLLIRGQAAASAHVDADLRQAMLRQGEQGPWPVRDRVVVAIDGRRNSEQVVRAGKRFAERRHAPWTVIYVDTGRARSPATRECLNRAFQLAERLGGKIATLRGVYIDAEILAYAREQNASAVIIGRTRERAFAGLFGRTLTQRLLRQNTDFEITVIGSTPEQPAKLLHRWKEWIEAQRGAPVAHYILAAWVVVFCTLVSAVLERLLPLPLPNLALIYLTGVLIVAARTSLPPALAGAGMSFLAYNFFFTEPRLTFQIHDTGEIISVFFFLVMAIIGGNLANRLRAQLAGLRATNDQSQILLSLSKKLAEAPEPIAAQRAAVETITTFEGVPVCLLAAESPDATLEVAAAAPEPVRLNDKQRAAATWTFKHAQPSGYQSDTLTSIGWRFMPLSLDETCYGVLGVKLSALPNRAPTEQLLMLDALANQVTLTLARARLTSSLQQARIAEENERLRSSLLSSVSHDLRTPLSSMIGAASSLRDLDPQLSIEDKRELLDAVLTEGQRLNRYIENLLDMTRLGHGTLKLQRDWVALTDIVASALRRTKELFTRVTVVRDIPHDLPLLYVHPALIEQALVNVIENAAHFSPEDGEIRIAARREQHELLITVTDQGPGIPEAQRQKVFDMFFTGGGSDQAPHGSGLGLAICHGMVGAHGGRIEALAGPQGKGTTIAIHLPLHELPSSAEDPLHHEHGKR